MTIKLGEIEARAEAATEGPWDYETPSGEDRNVFDISSPDAPSWHEAITLITSSDGDTNDVRFICRARTDVPEMAAWIRRASDLLAHIKRSVPNCIGCGDSHCVPCRAGELLAEIES